MKAYEILQDNKVEYKLTILILSLHNRLDKLSSLYQSLQRQVINHSVQIIYLGDNKSLSVGQKRNAAMRLVNGRYFCFIDDDDKINPNYVNSIMEAIEHNPDVITFDYLKTNNGRGEKLHKYYKNNYKGIYLAPDLSHYKLLPNHLSVWKKDIVCHDFPDKSVMEDHEWAESMNGHYKNVYNIEQVLYYYNYSKLTSETH